MADKFDEFLEEVEQDIRHERIEKLWKQYGKTIIIAVVGVLALTGGFMAWKNHQHKEYLVLSEQFVGAQNLLAQGKTTEAIGVMQALSKGSHHGYAILARFLEAALLSKEGSGQDVKGAQAIYDAIEKDRNAEQHFRDLATFFRVNLEIDRLSNTPDAAVIKNLIDALEPLTKPDNPWHSLAKELKGLLLYKQNKTAEASEIFISLIQDAKSPTELRMRAQLMSQVLVGYLSENKEAKKD
ncbi:MAG: tetratricopeptide repeat protein [Alphaproteobacteria bacterium]|nr:tetratricopeptide repeat protein [Alphaproteobacteria bacterium]